MKILQIIDNFDLGGAERMALNMANAFNDQGIVNVVCVTRSGGAFQSLLNRKIPLYILHKKHVLDLVAFFLLLQIIARHKPTVIHAHSSSYVWAVLAKLFFWKTTLIWHDHRGVEIGNAAKSRHLLRFFSNSMNAIIVVNEELKEKNAKCTSVPKDKIWFLKNFPDLRLPNQFEKSREEKIILCLANIRPEKNHSLLLNVFAQVMANCPQHKLKLWLAGKTFDPEYQKSLQGYTKELKLEKYVTFLGNVHDTAAVLAQAHIGVLSSKFEGLPVSLLEYGLASLPVLVPKTGYCPEVVDHGKCGWLAQPQDVESFATALQYMIEHWSESVDKGKRLRERVLLEYGAPRFVEEYVLRLNQLNLKMTA